jgi:hypothetical protein
MSCWEEVVIKRPDLLPSILGVFESFRNVRAGNASFESIPSLKIAQEFLGDAAKVFGFGYIHLMEMVENRDIWRSLNEAIVGERVMFFKLFIDYNAINLFEGLDSLEDLDALRTIIFECQPGVARYKRVIQALVSPHPRIRCAATIYIAKNALYQARLDSQPPQSTP